MENSNNINQHQKPVTQAVPGPYSTTTGYWSDHEEDHVSSPDGPSGTRNGSQRETLRESDAHPLWVNGGSTEALPTPPEPLHY